MPSSAGRVRMPHNNRMSTSASLKTHNIWSKTIGHDPYAGGQDDNNAAVENSETAVKQREQVLTLARQQNVTDGADRDDFARQMYLGLKAGKKRRHDSNQHELAATLSHMPEEDPMSSSEDEYVNKSNKATKTPSHKERSRRRSHKSKHKSKSLNEDHSSSSDKSSSQSNSTSSSYGDRKKRKHKRKHHSKNHHKRRRSSRRDYTSDSSSSDSDDDNHKRRKRSNQRKERKHSSHDKKRSSRHHGKSDSKKGNNEVDKHVEPREENNNTQKDFMAAAKFQGSKTGYVFKNVNKGVGYYVDNQPQIN